MTFFEEILNKSSVLSDEVVDYDRLFELVDAFEAPINIDYLRSEQIVKDIATEEGIIFKSSKYKKIKKEYFDNLNECIRKNIKFSNEIHSMLDDLRDELYAYTAVGINWMIQDIHDKEYIAPFLYQLFLCYDKYGEAALIYEVIKYMYDNFKTERDYLLP